MPAPPEPKRHLLHVFSTFAVGGPQTRFVSLANALKHKYRHTVLAMDGNLQAAQGLDKDVACDFAAFPVVKHAGISLQNLRHARRLLRDRNPDLLLTYNWGTIEWAIATWPWLPFRHVHVEDGFGPDESPQRQNPRRVLMRRVALSRCAAIIVPSATLFDVATRIWRFSPSRVIHLPNGIDCARFARVPDAASLAAAGIDGTAPVIGTVAALRPEKNLSRLVRAFAALPQALGARLVIVGGGPERDLLESAAARLGVTERVVLAGAMSNPETVLAGFDIFALSSDTEQMPNSILEAMAAGLPVVATDVGDLRRMMSPENAPFVVPRDDEAALTAALLALLQDRARRQDIGRRNRDHVVRYYSLDRMVDCYDTLFSDDWDGAAASVLAAGRPEQGYVAGH